MAEQLDADMLIILTAVEKVAINFGKPDQKNLDELTPDEARRYMAEGQFAPGSMLPKVEAAVKFAESKPGRTSLITLLEKAKECTTGVNEIAYRQAEADFFEAHKQITALEDQTMKFLTGENTVDISIINAMMPKYKEKLANAQKRMDETRDKMEAEKATAKNAVQEVTDLLSWAEAFDDATIEEKHMIIARLVERIDIGHDYEIEMKFRISVEQYMRIAA